MTPQPATRPPAALRVISFLSRMGARIHVQLRKGKPILFPYGATWEKAKRELTIKDSKGEEIGFFNRADVVGCWKEKLSDTTPGWRHSQLGLQIQERINLPRKQCRRQTPRRGRSRRLA